MAWIGGLIGLWGMRFVEQDAEAMTAQFRADARES
jgi:hypothetical protein